MIEQRGAEEFSLELIDSDKRGMTAVIVILVVIAIIASIILMNAFTDTNITGAQTFQYDSQAGLIENTASFLAEFWLYITAFVVFIVALILIIILLKKKSPAQQVNWEENFNDIMALKKWGNQKKFNFNEELTGVNSELQGIKNKDLQEQKTILTAKPVPPNKKQKNNHKFPIILKPYEKKEELDKELDYVEGELFDLERKEAEHTKIITSIPSTKGKSSHRVLEKSLNREKSNINQILLKSKSNPDNLINGFIPEEKTKTEKEIIIERIATNEIKRLSKKIHVPKHDDDEFTKIRQEITKLKEDINEE